MTAPEKAVSQRLLVAAATESEARLSPRGPSITLIRTGMGTDRALGMVRPALGGISGILSFGFAGGLSGEAENGCVLLPAEIMDEAGRIYPVDCRWHRRSLELLQDIDPATAPLVSVSRIAGSVTSKAVLRQSSPAVAVDMESAALARLAAETGLPFLVLRVVLDGPRDGIPAAASAAVAADGTLRVFRLLRELAVCPGALPDVLHLVGQHRRAARRLAEAARRGRPALISPLG